MPIWNIVAVNRTVVIGLDAFHEGLLEYTPNIRELYEENPSGLLESTEPPVTAPAWASFQTGKNQGKHGIYDFVTYDENYELEFLDGTNLRSNTFYELLDEQGYDCLLFNLPFTLPARIDGDIIPSWLDPDSADPFPEDLYDEYGISPPNYPELKGSRMEKIEEMKHCFIHNADQFLDLVTANEHDFLFQLVSATDWVQHNSFEQLKNEPDSDIAHAAVDLLEHVDDYIGRLESSLSDDDTLILISDHGFKLFDGCFYINDWLESNGFLTKGETNLGKMAQDQTKTINLGTAGQILAKQEWLYPVLRVIKNSVETVFDYEFDYESGLDFDNSSAYCLSKDECAIRIADNLTDDQRSTVVDEILDALSKESKISASRREDVYHGPYLEEAGEIIVHSGEYKASRGPVGRVETDREFEYHSSYGFITTVGDEIATPTIDAQLIDVMPTILSLFDIPIPEDIDGKPIKELAGSDNKYRTYPEYEPEFLTIGDEENDSVEERLTDLGYL